MTNQLPGTSARRSSLWAYNVRILLGSSYWLIIAPVAGAQLVLFWNMAVLSMSSSALSSRTIELAAPILAAFLCAHALAPEQSKVGELVFVRPVSIERVLVLRVVAIFAFVLLALSTVLILYQVKVESFRLGLTLLATLPSMLFVSMLALGIAVAVRQPLLGFAAAGAFWGLDLVTGSSLNPLVSLDSFSGWLSGRPVSELWVINKLVLVGVAALLYLWVRSMLGRPTAALRFRVVAARSALAIAIAFAYVASGAGCKLAYGLRREGELGVRAHLWYQTQFRSYGPIPVARLFGPAFALYLRAASGPALTNGRALGSGATGVDVPSLRLLQERYPESIWADNAQLLTALNALHRPASRPTMLIGCQAGSGGPSLRVVGEDMEAAISEFEALLSRYPDSPFAPFALSQLATIGLSRLDFEAAISAYERLMEHHPQATEASAAGRELSAYYLASGQPERALKVADIAAGVAAWDVRADALLSAAQAAERAGKLDVARDRYARARSAAAEAADQAIAGRGVAGGRTPSHLTKGELFERANAVIAAATRALSDDVEPQVAPTVVTSQVTGRILLDVRDVALTRVALGTAVDASGLPSPFAPGPAVAVSPGPDGGFAFASVPAGEYQVLAIALSLPPEKTGWSASLSPLALPVVVRGPSVELPPVRIRLSPQPVERSPASRGAGVSPHREARGRGGRRMRR
ncbi:MAG TPA: hypothetical protein VMY87_08830 [Armatimonadota bacterium]|nr:hypothetical protein [Armatimonadota bacterium]